MVQKLVGSLTTLCRDCRFLAPRPAGGRLEWHCLHREVTVVEVNEGRTLTFKQGGHGTTL
mgnify:CR=1 FL=1